MAKLTPIAVTKFVGLFANPNPLDTAIETKYDTVVCTTKITGITASSANLSAFNCLASFVKTIESQLQAQIRNRMQQTQAGCKQSYVQIRYEFLLIGIEHPLPCNNISW